MSGEPAGKPESVAAVCGDPDWPHLIGASFFSRFHITRCHNLSERGFA